MGRLMDRQADAPGGDRRAWVQASVSAIVLPRSSALLLLQAPPTRGYRTARENILAAMPQSLPAFCL